MSNGVINKKMPTKRDFVTVQTIDYYCRGIATTVGKPGLVHSYEREGLLFRQSEVDRSLKKVVTTSQHVPVHYMWQYSVLAGHPGERQL